MWICTAGNMLQRVIFTMEVETPAPGTPDLKCSSEQPNWMSLGALSESEPVGGGPVKSAEAERARETSLEPTTVGSRRRGTKPNSGCSPAQLVTWPGLRAVLSQTQTQTQTQGGLCSVLPAKIVVLVVPFGPCTVRQAQF